MTESSLTINDERNWALFTHLASFAGFIMPFGNLIGPFVIWLIKKNQSDLVDQHGKTAINFQISLLIWFILCIPLLYSRRISCYPNTGDTRYRIRYHQHDSGQ